jgi:hypothetical protein
MYSGRLDWLHDHHSIGRVGLRLRSTTRLCLSSAFDVALDTDYVRGSKHRGRYIRHDLSTA